MANKLKVEGNQYRLGRSDHLDYIKKENTKPLLITTKRASCIALSTMPITRSV